MRQHQISFQQPLVYFFVSQKDFKIETALKNTKKTDKLPIVQLKLAETITYRMFPLGKNEILVRFENLADLIDAKNESALPQFINIEQFADDLYLEENQIKATNFEIQEMSLQGVYP